MEIRMTSYECGANILWLQRINPWSLWAQRYYAATFIMTVTVTYGHLRSLRNDIHSGIISSVVGNDDRVSLFLC